MHHKYDIAIVRSRNSKPTGLDYKKYLEPCSSQHLRKKFHPYWAHDLKLWFLKTAPCLYDVDRSDPWLVWPQQFYPLSHHTQLKDKVRHQVMSHLQRLLTSNKDLNTMLCWYTQEPSSKVPFKRWIVVSFKLRVLHSFLSHVYVKFLCYWITRKMSESKCDMSNWVLVSWNQSHRVRWDLSDLSFDK